MKKIVLLLILATWIIVSHAQEPTRGKVSITVLNEKQSPLENVSVELRRLKDSGLVKAAISEKTGLTEFENIRFGNYFIKVSMVNYAGYSSLAFEVSANNLSVQLNSINLQPAATQLQTATVTARKPFIQKLTDRIVVNVENSIVSAGSSAIDVLERSPGVNIDQNDVISLRGRSGVVIMIDGKPSPMTGADLANYLRGLPSSAIERIEIITNPSARYDAAGNSGIIDIRLKKDQRLGTNGTFNVGYGQGVYPKANAGLTLNYRNKKFNAFGSYNYAYRVNLNNLILDRNFYEDGVYRGGDLKDNYAKMPFNNNTARFGMDFFPSDKTIIGFVVNTNFNHFKRNNNNSSIVINSQSQPINTFKALATNNDHSNNAVANINLKHRFDSTGRELTVDVDYGKFNSSSLTRNSTNYFKLDGSKLQPDYVLDGDQDGELQLKTAKFDYTHPLKKGAKFEFGAKTSFVSSDNDAKFFDVSSGTPQNDVNKTNHFIYKENNQAGYFNFSKEFKKFSFQLGLRGEQTNIKTEQKMGNVTFDSSYFQLFPSAFFNYKVKEDQTLGVSVSRRIDRPGYSQLNPFLFLIDVTTYSTGKPSLLPQLTWSYELSYTMKRH